MKHARKDYDRFQDPLGKIPEDEPVFLLRGQDVFAHRAVSAYALDCGVNGQFEVAALAGRQAEEMKLWSQKHGKRPDLPKYSTATLLRDALSEFEKTGNIHEIRELLTLLERQENG